MQTCDLESRTQEIGRDLFARARRAERTSPSDGLLDRMLMKWGMRDERLKAQLFRFIDVLPVLASPKQVNAHLREYLGTVRDRLPPGAGLALKMLPDDGWLGRQLADFARGGSSPPPTCRRRSPPSGRCGRASSRSRSTCSARRCFLRPKRSAIKRSICTLLKD